MPIFRNHGSLNSRNKEFQFWRQDNCPKELYSGLFISQKMNYIHYNPVKAGLVERPEHYLYSSARDYVLRQKTGLLDLEFI